MCRSILIHSPWPLVVVLMFALEFLKPNRESSGFHTHPGFCQEITSATKNTSATCKPLPHAESLTLSRYARVVEWQTRTFEGRMPKGMRVEVLPRALFYF